MRENYKSSTETSPRALYTYGLHFSKIFKPKKKKIRDRKENALIEF